jgi:hypothetical protein
VVLLDAPSAHWMPAEQLVQVSEVCAVALL